jgi:hypothetical protein
MEGPMAVPAPLVIAHRGAESRSHPFQQPLQDLQGESEACIAIGSLREDTVGEIPEPGDSEVSVKNLDDKQVNRGNRIQHALAKTIADITAHGENLAGIENLGNLTLDTAKSGVDVSKHG